MTEQRSIEILVVDDSPTMRQLVVHGLRRLPGAKLEEAGDGVEACKKLAGKVYDLVMLDINMPLLDGLKVLAHIRSSKNNATTAVIMLTTEGGEVEKQRAGELGANAYLTKPTQAMVLQRTVKQILGIG
ncbi:MAG: response regulator [Chrysiogenetes bacterium]|nr:response regulator [Chrysiogenetes bacterium]